MALLIRSLLALLTPILFSGAANATTVVVITTPTAVYLAADSLQNTLVQNVSGNLTKRRVSRVCKIARLNDRLFLALVGTVGAKTESGGEETFFDAHEIANAVADDDKTTDKLLQVLQVRLQLALVRVRSAIDEKAPQTPPLSITAMYARFDKAPEARGMELSTGSAATLHGADSYWVRPGRIGVAGVDPSVKLAADWLDRPLDTINEILLAATKKAPDAVGAPYEILKLDAAGATWIQRETCKK